MLMCFTLERGVMDNDMAPPVFLESTHIKTLELVKFKYIARVCGKLKLNDEKTLPHNISFDVLWLLLPLEQVIDNHPNGMPKVIKTYKNSNNLELIKEVLLFQWC